MFSCTQRTVQGKDFESILTKKMKTRHSVVDPFLLAASLRHLQSLRSYDGLESQDLDILKAIFAFFGKNDFLW